MKSIFKLVLILLTYFPVNAIAIAAHSKLLDIAGEEQTRLLMSQLRYSKSMLFQKGESETDLKTAYGRVKSLTGIQDEEQLKSEVSKHLNVLLQSGMIQIDENKITTALVSHMGGD